MESAPKYTVNVIPGSGSSTSNFQDVEVELLLCIDKNPGIRYRELLRMTGLANGVLAYHVAALERAGALQVERQPGNTRFFPTTTTANESIFLKHLRNQPEREIIVLLLSHEMCTFFELVELTGKAPSTISTHANRLRLAGIVSVRRGDRIHLYSLSNKELAAEMLSKYKSSLTDRIIDSYTEITDQL